MGWIEGIFVIGANGMNVLNAWMQGQERLGLIRDKRASLRERIDDLKASGNVAVETPPAVVVAPPLRAVPVAVQATELPAGSVSSVTTEETIAYQNRELAKTLLVLETHLSQGCEIAGKVCDCCSPKHPMEMQKLAAGKGLSPDEYEEIQSLRRQTYRSKDFKEGMQAFFERRPPAFTGE